MTVCEITILHDNVIAPGSNHSVWHPHADDGAWSSVMATLPPLASSQPPVSSCVASELRNKHGSSNTALARTRVFASKPCVSNYTKDVSFQSVNATGAMKNVLWSLNTHFKPTGTWINEEFKS